MKIPTVHLNGSSATELLRVNLNARQAVAEAVDALYRAAPNARDFYVQGDDAFSLAASQFKSQVSRLQDVYNELTEIVDGISDQIDQKEKQR